jgi:predicted transcriptional regulator of viral defense system
MITQERTHLENYLRTLQAKGSYSFTLKQVSENYPVSAKALRQALFRLQKQSKIASVRRGFYVIVPPEYSAWKILPPLRFIDDLMKFLNKPYYVGLLSSASLHGVSHQQPQVFQVITVKPPLRAIVKKGLKVEFVVKSEIQKIGIELKKTDSGYVKVASPELTALDIILYNKQIGGLSRALTLLTELAEVMNPEKLLALAKEVGNMAVLQRLGYLLAVRLGEEKLAAALFEELKDIDLKAIPLLAGAATKGFSVNKKWKVIENISLQSDFEE